MKLSKIVTLINKRLAGEMLMLQEIVTFLDSAVDDVNTRLNTRFPVFSDLEDGVDEYTAIPDKYIRTVLVPGAIHKFYVMDEEGSETAPQYLQEYITNLFYMERDYLNLVPAQYQETFEQGLLYLDEDHPIANRGLEIDGGTFSI